MHRHTLFIVLALCASVLVGAGIAGCSSAANAPGGTPSNSGGTMGNGGPGTNSGGGPNGNPGGGMMGGSSSGTYATDGERIYLSGVGTDGQNISRTAPRVSQGSLMMGGGGCGSCHAANGRGGTIRMMAGTAIKAPDITYDALTKAGFTDATIKKAILDGLDEAGKPLDTAMPRWQMRDADLNATIAYLKVLSAK